MNEKIEILEERISAEEYIDFLKRTDLGSQYPKVPCKIIGRTYLIPWDGFLRWVSCEV